MRFTFTAAAVILVAAAFSGAAIIPRANVKSGLEARYYRGEVYAREIPVENKPKVNVLNGRTHPREFRMKRSVV